MMQYIFFLLVFVCSLDVNCMKTISVKLQGVDNRNLTASVEADCNSIGLRSSGISETRGVDSINLLKEVFSIVLRDSTFSNQRVDIKDGNENNLFVLSITKKRENGRPEVLLHCTGVDALKGKLFQQCAGGGNAFILGIGDDNLSVAAIQSKQPRGSMQVFRPVGL